MEGNPARLYALTLPSMATGFPLPGGNDGWDFSLTT